MEVGLSLAASVCLAYVAKELFGDFDGIKLNPSQKTGKGVVMRLDEIRKRRKEEVRNCRGTNAMSWNCGNSVRFSAALVNSIYTYANITAT